MGGKISICLRFYPEYQHFIKTKPRIYETNEPRISGNASFFVPPVSAEHGGMTN